MVFNGAIMDKEIKVLDKGYVTILDHMGNDQSIIRAAKQSVAKEDIGDEREQEKFIRDLMRWKHLTPFEFCLDADTEIPCFYKEGVTSKVYTIKQIANAFLEKGRHNSWVKLINIRTVDPSGIIKSTKVKRAWKSGQQKVYAVTEDSLLNRRIIVTDNHPFLTPTGYKKLTELNVGDEIYQNGVNESILELYNLDLPIQRIANQVHKSKEYIRHYLWEQGIDTKKMRLAFKEEKRKYSKEDESKVIQFWEQGKSLKEISSYTNISNGTCYWILKRNNIDTKKRKNIFWRHKDKKQYADPRYVARRTISAKTCGVSNQESLEIHHLDGNPNNNAENNLVSVCKKIHKAFHHSKYYPDIIYTRKIKSIECLGERDVYDLEVESDNHNFVANGFVVHNCQFTFRVKAPLAIYRQWHRSRSQSYVERSGRFTELPAEFYVPDNSVFTKKNPSIDKEPITLGKAKNIDDWVEWGCFGDTPEKGSKAYDTEEFPWSWSKVYSDEQAMVRKNYEKLLGTGVRKEIARLNLPLAQYSEMYMTTDLRNLFHFLELRLSSGAQWEIRQYAHAILELITPIVPYSCQAFQDYILNSVTLSSSDIKFIQQWFKNDSWSEGEVTDELTKAKTFDTKREEKECLTKLKTIFGSTIKSSSTI